MYKYFTIALILAGNLCLAQENSSDPSLNSISGDNLIVSWTLGEVVAGYAGFDKPIDNQNIYHSRFTIKPVKETQAAQLIKIHPSPNADFVVVHLKHVDVEELTLKDDNGKVLMRKELPKSTKSYELNLADQNDGTYYLTIASDHKVELQKFKIIKSTVSQSGKQ